MRKFQKYNFMAVNFMKRDIEKSSNGQDRNQSEEDSVNPRTLTPEKCSSEFSSMSTNSDICRICHCEGDDGENGLVAPCYCSGSLRYVHQQCLQQWIKTSDIKCCELCKFQFVMETKLKPISQWECLDITPLEKRKLLSRITFNILALTCATYSLLVLTDRATDELLRGLLEWPLWVKLLIVGIGAGGTGIYIYKEGKDYISLFRKWRAYNRVIFIQNAPKNPGLVPSESPVRHSVESVCSPTRNYSKTVSITLNTLPEPLLDSSLEALGEEVAEKDETNSVGLSTDKSDICDTTENKNTLQINLEGDCEYVWS